MTKSTENLDKNQEQSQDHNIKSMSDLNDIKALDLNKLAPEQKAQEKKTQYSNVFAKLLAKLKSMIASIGHIMSGLIPSFSKKAELDKGAANNKKIADVNKQAENKNKKLDIEL